MKSLIKTSIELLITSVFFSTVFSPNQIAKAQNCNYYAGKAVGGQSVNVDLCSISRASYRSIDFVYYLGETKIQSQANCEAGTWTSFPERRINRPQSQATQNMLDVVCQYRNPTFTARTAVVFDPPSNVRKYPNGEILCSVRSRTTINIYGSIGEWYYTDACGQIGVIHSGQVKF
ncbi:MAG: hypothetical protein ACM37W_09360 [Actinomycetota bacterium]